MLRFVSTDCWASCAVADKGMSFDSRKSRKSTSFRSNHFQNSKTITKRQLTDGRTFHRNLPFLGKMLQNNILYLAAHFVNKRCSQAHRKVHEHLFHLHNSQVAITV